MFDNPGGHLFIPCPPPCLSAAAGTAQSATTKRHMDNLMRSTSYVQFVPSPMSPRSARPATAPSVKQLRSYEEPAVLTYVPDSRIEAMAMSLDLDARVAGQRDEDAAHSKHKYLTMDTPLTDKDVSRDRAMCSSPRERMSASARKCVLDGVQQKIEFARFLTPEKKQHLQETLSPPRAVDRLGTAQQPQESVTSAANVQPNEVINTANNGELSQTKGRRPATSSFASQTQRFARKHEHTPPVGHYNARFALLEHSPRAAVLRDSRSTSCKDTFVSVDDGMKPHDADERTPNTAADQSVDATDSARERTKRRLAAQENVTKALKPSPSFISNVPQIFFHEMYFKTHPSLSVEVANDPNMLLPTHNSTTLSATPRVVTANLAAMSGRDPSTFIRASDAPDIITYQEPTTTLGLTAMGNLDFGSLSSRPGVGLQVATGTSVEDHADLMEADRVVCQRRVILVPRINKQSGRRQKKNPSGIPPTVSVELLPDRRAIYKPLDKHQRVISLDHMKRSPVTEGDDNASHVDRNPSHTSLHHTEAFACDAATAFNRQPSVNFAMHSSHHDTQSFAKIAEHRVARGELPATDIGTPKIDVTRARVTRNVRLEVGSTREQNDRQAAKQAVLATNRVQLDNVDSPLRKKRISGNPHIALHTSRDQRCKEGSAVASELLDKFYDVNYAAASQKVKLVGRFEQQVNRDSARGGRSDAKLRNRDITPGPGAYNV